MAAKIKDRWGYNIDDADGEIYEFFGTREAALKDAHDFLKRNPEDFAGESVRIYLFRLAEVVTVAVDIKEVEKVVVHKQVTIKENI